MAGISAMQSALTGIHTGMNAIRQDAHVIATQSITTDSKDVTEAVIDMKANQHQVEASSKVIKVQDEILGTLLDELA